MEPVLFFWLGLWVIGWEVMRAKCGEGGARWVVAFKDD